MELRFTRAKGHSQAVYTAVFLAAVFAVVFATLDWLHLLPFAALGVAVAFVPGKYRKFLWGALAVFAMIRFGAIWDGVKILANRLFYLSEQTQSYEYAYFPVRGESCVEAVIFLSMLLGSIPCAGIPAGAWVIAMAYFGVTPDAVWLVLLLLVGLVSVLPARQRWFYGLMVGALVVAIAFAVGKLAPEPNPGISELDEILRDSLAFSDFVYEQEPVPTEVPEPELIPKPETELQQPDHGVQRKVINILIMILGALTLALLFIPAVIRDRAEKRSLQARAGMDDPNHAAAIKAMYLYAQRWRKLSAQPMEIPEEVYAIWQEAAYSDHAMTEAQREVLHSYMVETANAVWNGADRKKRLHIRYRICL